ncbi:hypothetical protein [Niallia sp. MER TA 168]|uniref:hypothetical protein n=1 Tax=Niallia sp. MER TA 168 TaxID=2939568 RepID=UPI00203F2189|nr:hypothetical protein [Niallia sp. MER TA 168]MCM3361234.1 hypothetical protein [Niallia sp. MER TA 168]
MGVRSEIFILTGTVECGLKRGEIGRVYIGYTDLISDICISMKAVDFLKMSEKISNRIEVAMNKKEQELYMGVDHSVRHLGY